MGLTVNKVAEGPQTITITTSDGQTHTVSNPHPAINWANQVIQLQQQLQQLANRTTQLNQQLERAKANVGTLLANPTAKV